MVAGLASALPVSFILPAATCRANWHFIHDFACLK
jgi:hypothetical protein